MEIDGTHYVASSSSEEVRLSAEVPDANGLALQVEADMLVDDIVRGERFNVEELTRELFRALGPFQALMAFEIMRSSYIPRT